VRRAFEELATGRYTKQEVMARATEAGLRSRKGLAISPQSFGQMMRNPIYVGKVESPDYGVSTRADFDPLVDEATFYRAQAVLDGRVVVAGPRQRNHPDFPLRGFVHCERCGRPLTGSWSKGRNGHYAYYNCQRQCRAVNDSKARLEGAFADELALLQPSAGYMRLVKDRILYIWEQRRAEAKDRTAEQEKRVKAIQQKLDRLDEAFLFQQSIDAKSYERQRDRLREELTLAQIDQPRRCRRRTRRTGHPGVRRTHPAAGVRPVGPGVARLQAATAAVVLPGRRRVRRKSIQSNRRNRTTLQLLGAVCRR
jgi:site-specific DNA recombinase